MRSHIRLFIMLAVTLLALCIVSSGSHSASTETRARQTASGWAGSNASERLATEALCDARVWQQQQQQAASSTWGESFDSDSYLPHLKSHAEFAHIIAPAFGAGISTIEAMPDPNEPFIAGLPSDEAEMAAAANVPPTRVAQIHDVDVGPNGELMFDPFDVVINVGDTVRWTWRSPNHTVTSGPGCTSDNAYCSPSNTNCSVGSASTTGFIYTHTFNTPGTYLYFCKIHCSTFNMKGQVTVQGAASTFSISGTVTTGGNPVSGATMTLSGAASASTTTSATGTYSFSNLATGNYTVTPTDIRYTFTPSSRSYTSLSANQANQDYTATPEPLTISGQVRQGTTGLASVTMTLTSPTPAGFTPKTTTTDASGNYSLTNVPAGRNYTLTPSKSGFTFKNTSNTAQSTRTYTNLSANQINQDFTATAAATSFTISGQVKQGTTALAAVTMTLTSPSPAGFTPRTVQTNSTGNYSFADVPGGRNYTLTPSKSGFTFTPVNRTYSNLSANQTAQNFAATATTTSFTISGFVKVGTTALAGVTMTLTSPSPAGFTPRTVMTTSTGSYSFVNVPGGRNYTLTPSKTGYAFTPTSKAYTNLSANQANQNFAAGIAYTISGLVKVGTTALAGVTMTLTSPTPAGFTPRTVMTTSTGSFSLTNVPGGRNYILTPSKTGYAFTPTSKAYTNLSANQANQNFAAGIAYTISGLVKVGTTALAGVTMTLTSPTPAGFTPRTVQTNSTGSYSFANVPGGRSYILTPTKTNYTFTPASKSYSNLSANQANQNFAATLKLYTISGRVTQSSSTTTGIGAVTMTLSSPTPAGFTPRTVQTNSTGNFSFTSVPAARNYTLTPSKSGLTFNPTSRSYTNLSANQSGAAASFTGTPTAPRPSIVEFSESSYRIGEGDGRIEITVTRSGDVSQPATVDYESHDNTASDRSDYSTTLGTLRFDAGETSKTFRVFITDDAYVEGDETIYLTLGNGTNGVEAGSAAAAMLTITDNDTDAAAANPIDDPAFFVRQQHVDFLNRDVEPDVLSTYTDNFKRCVAQELCDRVALSGSFNRNFKTWGDVIYRLYKLSFGRAPVYREFIRDTNRIRSLIKEEKGASTYGTFLGEWVERPAFKQRYGALSDRDFVLKLSEGSRELAADSESQVNALESGILTRAEVLNEMLGRAEFSEPEDDAANISMLFFGYLRRDTDEEGLKTLLEIKRQHPKDYRPLIEAIINSVEYRSRFGRP